MYRSHANSRRASRRFRKPLISHYCGIRSWYCTTGGVYATLHAGLHWQKAAIWVLLDMHLPDA